jgi:hypothetical protein
VIVIVGPVEVVDVVVADAVAAAAPLVRFVR